MMASSIFYLGLLVDVIVHNVCSERDDSDAKSGEDVPEHGCSREDRMFAPGLPLRPGVSVELILRHFLQYIINELR